MATQHEVETSAATLVEADCNAAIENTLLRIKGNHTEAALLARDAVTFLSTAGTQVDTLQRQGFFGRLMGAITGRSAILRNSRDRNIIQAQNASLRLIQRLSEQNLLQMDAITALGNMISYLQFDNRENLRIIKDLFASHDARIRKLEDSVENINKINFWVNSIFHDDYEKIKNKSLRLLAFVVEAFKIGNVVWSGPVQAVFETQLRKIGYAREDEISIKEFVSDIVKMNNPASKLHFEDLVINSSFELDSSQFPCYYAICEANKIHRTDQEYGFISAILEYAAQKGSHLDQAELRTIVIENYLKSMGVKTDAKVKFISLANEILFGANIMRTMTTLPTLSYELPQLGLPEATTKKREADKEIEGFQAITIPSSGKRIFVKPDSMEAVTYAEAKKILTNLSMRMPTLDEAVVIWTIGVDNGISISQAAEWVESGDDDEPRVIAPDDYPQITIKFRNSGRRARTRGVLINKD